MEQEEEKKYYELNEDERALKRHLWWKAHKETVKKIILAIVCVIAIILMFMGLLANVIWNKPEETPSQALINTLLNL